MNAVMNSVYNNYLTTYSPKSITRYDTHKRSELRSVYNSIVKLNKESPWYLPITSKTTQQYAVDIKENARVLHNTIAHISGMEENGLLSKKSAYSTNQEIAAAHYIGTTKQENELPNFSLEVQTLASAQENLGLFLADDDVKLAPDTYSFDISINDTNYEFQFTIGESERIKEVQQRLVRLINNSGIGLKASLIESEERNALRLTSESTGLPSGKNCIFTISDDHTSKASGTVAYFGLDYISHNATDAHFLIDGVEHSSSANHFTLGKLYEIELKAPSPEGQSVAIGLKPDIESVTDNITHLVGGYNAFLKAAATYLESQSGSHKLIQEMRGIASAYGQPMASMGLTLQKDGTMEIDDTRLKEAISEAEDIAQSFEYMKDFSNMLLYKTNQVSLDPMEYVDKTIVAYKNPHRSYVSPYSTSAYSGMMFSGYC